MHVRWMIQRDLAQVVAIEQASFDFPWNEEDFRGITVRRNCIGLVVDATDPRCDCESRIRGYMVYELLKTRINLLTLAVHPKHRRQGVGCLMLNKLKGKLSTHRRYKLTVDVRESNLDAQLFFRSCGLLATRVERYHFPDTGEAAYRMQHTIKREVEA